MKIKTKSKRLSISKYSCYDETCVHFHPVSSIKVLRLIRLFLLLYDFYQVSAAPTCFVNQATSCLQINLKKKTVEIVTKLAFLEYRKLTRSFRGLKAKKNYVFFMNFLCKKNMKNGLNKNIENFQNIIGILLRYKNWSERKF